MPFSRCPQDVSSLWRRRKHDTCANEVFSFSLSSVSVFSSASAVALGEPTPCGLRPNDDSMKFFQAGAAVQPALLSDFLFHFPTLPWPATYGRMDTVSANRSNFLLGLFCFRAGDL